MVCDTIPPCRLSTALVFDISGSIGDVGINDEIRAGIEFIQKMDSLDEAAIVTFHHDVFVLSPMTTDRRYLIDTLKSIYSFGGTALWDGAYQGVIEASRGRNGCKAVVLISDGANNAGFLGMMDVIRLANNYGIPIYTIGLGAWVDEAGLLSLAGSTGGKYYRSPSSWNLADIYQSILKELTKPECTITYEIDCPDGTLRTVDLELLSCGWAMETRQYIAHLDTSIFISSEIVLKDTTLFGGDTVTIPLKLSREVPLKNARFTILSCGQIFGFGKVIQIPGGIEITSDTLGSITIITPVSDTLCSVEIRWTTEGCVNPVGSKSYISLSKRKPVLSCVMSLTGDTATIVIQNRGTGEAKDVRLWTGQMVSLGNVIKTITYTWLLTDTCVYTLSENHPTLICCVSRPIKIDTPKVDTIPPPRKIFCRAEATDSTVTVFADSAMIYILQSNKFIAIPPSVQYCKDSVTFRIKRVADGTDTIRILAVDGVASFCEVILSKITPLPNVQITCSKHQIVKIGDDIFVTLILSNSGAPWSGMLVFLGAQKVTGDFKVYLTLGQEILTFVGRAILAGEDTLIFKLGDKECRVPVTITETKPNFDLSCTLTSTHFTVTVTNTGDPDTVEVFILVPPGVTSEYPIRKIFVAQTVTLVWEVHLPQGRSKLQAIAGKKICESEITIPEPGKRYLSCDGPDTLFSPGEAFVFAWGDSIITLVPNGYRVLSTNPWKVYFSKTATLLFIMDTMKCEKRVIVLHPVEEKFCKIFAPDTVDSVAVITAQVGGLEYVTLAINAEYLTPPTVKDTFRWVVRFPRYFKDTTIIAYLPFCQKSIVIRGRPSTAFFSLPQVTGRYGEKIEVLLTVNAKDYSVGIKYDKKVARFLYPLHSFVAVKEDSLLRVSGSQSVILVFEGLSKTLAETSLEFERNGEEYADGRIVVSGDCIIPLEFFPARENYIRFNLDSPTYVSVRVVDLLGREIYHTSGLYTGETLLKLNLTRGAYLVILNDEVTKIMVE